MLPGVCNLLEAKVTSSAVTDEVIAHLVSRKDFRLEHIQSFGFASPEGFWYDQSEDEWVVLIRGAATLQFEGGETLDLKTGDFLHLPPGLRHRLVQTSEDATWLALHAAPEDIC